MSRILTTSKLIDTVRRRAMIPDDTSTFDDDDIIDILNEEIDTGLLSNILSLHEEHFVTFEETDVVSGVVNYTIPYRAIGNKLRDAALVDTDGAFYELSRTSLEELSDYNYTRSSNIENIFYVQGDEIIIVDTVTQNYDKVRQYFYLRPNVLVKESEIGVISAIDRDTGVITLTEFPDKFSNIPDMDFVKARTPNKIVSYDITPTEVNRNTRTVTFNVDDIPASLVVGDYLCQKEETPVPNIPTEFHPVLAQRVAVHILEALGDDQGLKNAQVRLSMMEKSVMQIIDDRVEGSAEKINPRHTPLRTAAGKFYRYKSSF